jgi:nucleoid-associated protein EbfC
MFDKLFQVQQKAEEVKKKLETVFVTGDAEGGNIKVTMNGNRLVTAVDINPDFLAAADKEELEELLMVAINKASEKAEAAHNTEMQTLSQDMLGGLGSLGDMFKG